MDGDLGKMKVLRYTVTYWMRAIVEVGLAV